MSITRKQLTVAGLLALTNAVLMSLSLSIAVIIIPFIQTSCYRQVCSVLSNISVLSLALITIIRHGAYEYIFLLFKKLLNYHFQFYAANIFLSKAIWLNRLSLALTFLNLTSFLIGFATPTSRFEWLGWILLFGIVFYCLAMILVGITYILTAAEILRLSQNVHDKVLESLARTLTFTGWLIATILLAPFGFLLAVQADVLLGSIFFRRERES